MVPPLLALAVTVAVIAVLTRTTIATLALDHPNQRSLHAQSTPRLGGIGIAAGVAAAWWYAGLAIDWRTLLALALLTGISLLDDLRGIAVPWRLAMHLGGALLAMSAALEAHPLWLMLIAAVATAWMINLYNFMDGADGLAGGMTAIGFGAYGIAAALGSDFTFASVNLAIAAAALGFLFFNFPPAKVFMGDAGAIPLGCLAAVFGVAGWSRGNWPLWFGAVVFSPFIVDASLTLLKRLARGARVWHAHREHYYQRLVQNGLGHRKTALAEYALMTVCGAIACAAMRLEPSQQSAVLIAVAAMYLALILLLESLLPRHA